MRCSIALVLGFGVVIGVAAGDPLRFGLVGGAAADQSRDGMAAGLAAVPGPGMAGAAADAPRLEFGRPATPEEIAAADIDVRADGAGLPPGQGSVAQGEALFASTCAPCHGERGQKPVNAALRLTGGRGTLATSGAVQTVGSYWPYATTLFDYIRRAMPFPAPQSLSADQVYALTAYVLRLNDIVPDDTVLDADSLPKIRMPNREGFVDSYRPGR